MAVKLQHHQNHLKGLSTPEWPGPARRGSDESAGGGSKGVGWIRSPDWFLHAAASGPNGSTLIITPLKASQTGAQSDSGERRRVSPNAYFLESDTNSHDRQTIIVHTWLIVNP